MIEKTYNQREIISLAYGEVDIISSTYRVYQKRFQKLAAFLQQHPDLDWRCTHNRGDYFLNITMNIQQQAPKKGESYQYNAETAILFAVLLRGYEIVTQDGAYFFEDYLLKGKSGTDEQCDEWFLACKQNVRELIENEALGKETGEQERGYWESADINILSQLYRIAHPAGGRMVEDDHFDELYLMIKSLPFQQRQRLFDKIHNRLQWIRKEAEYEVAQLDEADKVFFDVDVALLKDKIKSDRS